MENYVIFVDAGADIPADLCQKYEIHGVPMEYLLADKPGVFRPEDPERDAHCAAFYSALRDGASISTSQITPFTFESCFAPELAAGRDVLYCCFSSGMSATWQNVQATVLDLAEKYPRQKLRCVDTRSASGGEGMTALQAALNRAQGMSLEENARWLEEHAKHMCTWFTVGDLNFLKRGGRISPTIAFLGGKLQIKPMLIIDEDGKLIVTQKARGQKASMQNLLKSYLSNLDFQGGARNVFTIHGGTPAVGAELTEMVRAASPSDINLRLVQLSPIIGAHTGPDMLCISHYGTSRK
jgi:DegV family protein with EDD domain